MKIILVAMGRNALGLGAFALLTTLLISLTYEATAERIALNKQHAKMQALYAMLPQGSYDNDLSADTLDLSTLDSAVAEDLILLGVVTEDKLTPIYQARLKGQVTRVLLPVVAPDGYTTAITLWLAVQANGAISSVRVVEQQETPGLGDKIDVTKSPWSLQFKGRSLSSPSKDKWLVRKDGGEFDQITGATISSRALVRALSKALLFFEKHQQFLLATAKNEF